MIIIQGLSAFNLNSNSVIYSCIHTHHFKVLSAGGEDIMIQSHDHQGYGILQECMRVCGCVFVCCTCVLF